MSINLTSTWLEAKQAPTIMNFSGSVLTASVALSGAGGIAGNGYPLPIFGKITKLYVYDGAAVRSTETELEVSPGDKISLYATYLAGSFIVELVLNGGTPGVQVGNCGTNTDLFCSLLIEQRGA